MLHVCYDPTSNGEAHAAIWIMAPQTTLLSFALSHRYVSPFLRRLLMDDSAVRQYS